MLRGELHPTAVRGRHRGEGSWRSSAPRPAVDLPEGVVGAHTRVLDPRPGHRTLGRHRPLK
jgi:hypothetical protein